MKQKPECNSESALWHAHFVVGSSATGNGDVSGTILEATAADIGRAVKAARYVFDSNNWGESDQALTRSKLLMALANKVREHAVMLARLDACNGGKPLAKAEADMADATNCFDYYAGLATKISGETVPVPMNLNFRIESPFSLASQFLKGWKPRPVESDVERR